MAKPQLSESEQQQLVNLLSRLEPGFLPYEIFIQIARLAVLSIIEFVPLRLNKDGAVEVLLLSRGEDDPIWPTALHTPGTVIRPTDTEGKMYRAFERITLEELAGTKVSNPHFVGSQLQKSERGTEQAQIFWVEVLGEPSVGQFYAVENLPDNLIQAQLKFIKLAATSFVKYRKTAN